MSNDLCIDYLFDLIRRLLLEAREAKRICDSLRGQELSEMDYEFQTGRALCYYEVLSIIIGQAQVFGLDMDALGLQGIDPDALLLS